MVTLKWFRVDQTIFWQGWDNLELVLKILDKMGTNVENALQLIWKRWENDEEHVEICSNDYQVGQKIKISKMIKWDVLVWKCDEIVDMNHFLVSTSICQIIEI